MTIDLPDDPAARAALLAALLTQTAPSPTTPPVRPRTIGEAADAFLADAAARGLDPRTVRQYGVYLTPVLARYGTVSVADLDPAKLEALARR